MEIFHNSFLSQKVCLCWFHLVLNVFLASPINWTPQSFYHFLTVHWYIIWLFIQFLSNGHIILCCNSYTFFLEEVLVLLIVLFWCGQIYFIHYNTINTFSGLIFTWTKFHESKIENFAWTKFCQSACFSPNFFSFSCEGFNKNYNFMWTKFCEDVQNSSTWKLIH